MKKKLLNAVILALSVSFLLGPQLKINEQEEKPTAKKLDEYGDVQCELFAEILDEYANHLYQEPVSKAYVIIYPGRTLPGRTTPHFYSTKAYLMGNRGIDEKRLVILNGPEREELKVELWLVPNGATPPQPEESNLSPRDKSLPIKYNVSYPHYPSEPYVNCCVGNCLLRYPLYDDFANALRKMPDSIGYFILYKGQGDNFINRRKLASELREVMTRKYRIKTQRIKIILAARMVQHETQEMWIVPKGTSAPKLSN
jgi:hypothetical protein